MNKDKVSIIGSNKKIGSLLSKKGYITFQYGRLTQPSIDFTSDNLKKNIEDLLELNKSNKFLILSGFLQNKCILQQSKKELIKSKKMP